MWNQSMILGNLTRDPELRQTASGKEVCNFTVASNRKYKDSEEKCFLEIVAWSALAKSCSEYLNKGSRVLVVGRLVTDTWTHEGETKSKIKMVAETVKFLSSSQRQQAPLVEEGMPGEVEPF